MFKYLSDRLILFVGYAMAFVSVLELGGQLALKSYSGALVCLLFSITAVLLILSAHLQLLSDSLIESHKELDETNEKLIKLYKEKLTT